MKTRAQTAVLLLALALLALPAHVRTQQQEPVVLRYRGIVYPGDTFAPHLYDLHLNGVNQYAVVGLQPGGSGKPFTVYGWSEITIEELMYPVWPKANTLYSKTGIIGLYIGGIVEPGTTFVFQPMTAYERFSMAWTAIRGNSLNVYGYHIYDKNTWLHLVRVFTSSRLLSYWINGNNVYSASIPSTDVTILEYDPQNSSCPSCYKRFVLGASTALTEHTTVRYGYVRIYSRALTDVEISDAMGGVVNASGLRLFIDPTFFDGTKYVDLSGNGNHAYPYNNPLRVPAERPFLWVVRGLYGDGVVRFRFVPRGWHVVVRDATGAEVLHLDTSYLQANAAGLVDEVRLDIVVPGVYEVVLSSVYPLPGEAAVGFGESLLVYSLAGACVVLPVVVAGSRRFELAAVVSSVYFATVFLYLASGSSVGTWGVALSLAGLSVPLMFLLSLADLRRFRAEPAAVASVTLAAVLHLVSLGVAAGYGVVPVELGVAYASATVLLWVALVVFGAVRKGLGVVRRVVVVE